MEIFEEMENYWIQIGEGKELDLSKWMNRFTNDMIFRIATGSKVSSISSYYYQIMKDHDDKDFVKESEGFIVGLKKFIDGMAFVFIYNDFIKKYLPGLSTIYKNHLKNRDFIFNKFDEIIKKRRIEIENTPLEVPLNHDMLTSFITANTSRDINPTKHVDPDLLRPMTDLEIRANMIDAFIGGTGTV